MQLDFAGGRKNVGTANCDTHSSRYVLYDLRRQLSLKCFLDSRLVGCRNPCTLVCLIDWRACNKKLEATQRKKTKAKLASRRQNQKLPLRMLAIQNSIFFLHAQRLAGSVSSPIK